jgi:hypothetical protein
MAARSRASYTDDDSISDHFSLEMVRINPPQTTSTNLHVDAEDQTMLDESAGTYTSNGTTALDLLSQHNISLTDGIQREYEIPNLFTFKKVWIMFDTIRQCTCSSCLD